MDVILWGSLGTYVAQQDAGSRASAPFLIGACVTLPAAWLVARLRAARAS